MKRRVIPLGDLSRGDAALAGSKAANLAEVAALGATVPEGFVVTTDVYADYLKRHGLDPLVAKALSGVDFDDEASIDHASDSIRKLFGEHPIDLEVRSDIEEFLAGAHGDEFAVRSSGTAEDLKSASFAGQYDTFLFVSKKRVIGRILDCWASLFAPRAILYRSKVSQSGQDIGMAVIIQRMIAGDYSGVIFTTDPEHPKYLLIELVLGVGEALVSGGANPDGEYLVSKASARIIQRRERGSFHIPNEIIMRLFDWGVRLADHFGDAQDIEFTVRDGVIYFLQSRPLTMLK